MSVTLAPAGVHIILLVRKKELNSNMCVLTLRLNVPLKKETATFYSFLFGYPKFEIIFAAPYEGMVP